MQTAFNQDEIITLAAAALVQIQVIGKALDGGHGDAASYLRTQAVYVKLVRARSANEAASEVAA